ncbi:MAG TPA: protein kinase [Planctomycetota bacterium]|nr:protein kinase [Planctomycetota bacterium]
MAHEPDNDLDSHLDRLLETAYESLGGASDGPRRTAFDPATACPERIARYPVLGLLGRGGTSLVFKGRDPELGRELAIKVIDARYAASDDLARRFLDEARLCSQLSHPGIVPIYDMGRLDDGRPYFTMQLVEGQTLAVQLDDRRDPNERLHHFLEAFARICETVAFAHARGIVHGDLKPGNVMVAGYGQIQVMDWGFSRFVDAARDGANGGEGRIMGTPAFMAPEQATRDGTAVDARTDVFGLGAILCVILTGAPPFLGHSGSEVRVRATKGHLGDALARLRGSGADPELVQLAENCLALAPDDRPADADRVAARMSAWFTSIKERARRLEVEAAQAQAKAVEQRRTRRRTVALAVLVVAFAAVYSWMQFERQARDYETRLSVAQAIERAQNLRTGADIAGPERIRWLGEAALAAQHAKALASTLDDLDLRQAAERLCTRLDADHDAAVRDEAMMKWLDDFPSHLDLSPDQLDREFARGFRDYGVDVEGEPTEQVVAHLRASSIAPSLARALDDWGILRRAQPGGSEAAWRRFHEIALRIDADGLRTAVRRAMLAGDVDALRRFADDGQNADAPTDTLDLLANCLAQANQRQPAIEVWQRANSRHPDSVRVIHSLAVHHFGAGDCPPWDEIVRLFSAGTALRPDNSHLWTDFSHALQGQGDLAAAEAALQRALELNAHDERALGSFVDLLQCEGRTAELQARCRAVAERAPDSAGIWVVFGDTMYAQGHLLEAADAYRRAVALDGAVGHREHLAQCLFELGDLDETASQLRAVLQSDPDSTTARANLGLLLRLQGHFTEALEALRAARGPDGQPWARRCDAWIDETERAAAAERTLAEMDASAPTEQTPDATVELALVAQIDGRSLLAARLYRDVFRRDPNAADGVYMNYNLDWATAAAAAAASGRSRDAAQLDAEARAAWRAQAAAWRLEAIAALERAFENGDLVPRLARRRFDVWRHEPTGPDWSADGSPVAAAWRELEARVQAGEPGPTVQVPFDRWFTAIDLGRVPGALSPYGGLVFDRADPDLLLVGGHAQRRTGGLYAVAVARDAGGHIERFAGHARHVAAAPFIDGGLAYGPNGAIFYTRYATGEIGQIRAQRLEHRVDKLLGPSAGGLQAVAEGLPGAGRVKILAWPGGEWFDAAFAKQPEGPSIVDRRLVTSLPGGPDGFVHVPAGGPFDRPSVLVAEWSRDSVAAYDADDNGDPLPETRRLVLRGYRGALGLAFDPSSGDVIVSTWRNDGTERLVLLRRERN